MSCQFTTMFSRLRGYPGKIAYRESWDEDKWLFVGTSGRNNRPVLYVHEGIHTDPYSVQQSDLFARDWEVEDG